jgi:hypothetical protein
MGASHMGSSLRAWVSLLTLSSREPLRVDGYDPFSLHHANRQQVSAPIFAILGVSPQRVAASAVHI